MPTKFAIQYAKRKATGLCVRCGKGPSPSGVLCDSCVAKHRARQKRCYTRARASGRDQERQHAKYVRERASGKKQERQRKQGDRIEARTGFRQILPEWKILEIEDQRKWNKENIHRR
jgi:hypothetical protein